MRHPQFNVLGIQNPQTSQKIQYTFFLNFVPAFRNPESLEISCELSAASKRFT